MFKFFILPTVTSHLVFFSFFFILLPHTYNNLFTIHIHTLIRILKHQITLLTILHLRTLHYNTCLTPI